MLEPIQNIEKYQILKNQKIKDYHRSLASPGLICASPKAPKVPRDRGGGNFYAQVLISFLATGRSPVYSDFGLKTPPAVDWFIREPVNP